jgi:hypothetical protein
MEHPVDEAAKTVMIISPLAAEAALHSRWARVGQHSRATGAAASA